MNEVLVDIRKYDLADRLKVDMISVEELLTGYEDMLDKIERLEDKVKELERDLRNETKNDSPSWFSIDDHEPSWWRDGR